MKTNWKRIMAMLTLLTLTGALLAGCSGGAQAPAAASTAEEEASTAAEEASTAAEEAGAASSDSAEADTAASEAEEAATEAEAEEDEEDYTTGDASLDDPRNADDIGDQELLVVSFGTSFNDNRRETIGAIEGALEEAFPDWSVRRAFTSQIIIDHIEKRDGVKIDNVTEALDRALVSSVKKLVVQPTHLMNGFEYNDLVEELAKYSDSFEQIAIGEPLLTSDADFDSVAEAIVKATEQYDDGNTAICFMGHGTEADSNSVYTKMQDVLAGKGYENYYIGTVEAEPMIDDVLEAASSGAYTNAVLRPLMIVAGDHANNDMAGDEEDSWKSIMTAEGYNVNCVVEGLGSLEDIQQLFVAHAQAAIDTLN